MVSNQSRSASRGKRKYQTDQKVVAHQSRSASRGASHMQHDQIMPDSYPSAIQRASIGPASRGAATGSTAKECQTVSNQGQPAPGRTRRGTATEYHAAVSKHKSERNGRSTSQHGQTGERKTSVGRQERGVGVRDTTVDRYRLAQAERHKFIKSRKSPPFFRYMLNFVRMCYVSPCRPVSERCVLFFSDKHFF